MNIQELYNIFSKLGKVYMWASKKIGEQLLLHEIDQHKTILQYNSESGLSKSKKVKDNTLSIIEEPELEDDLDKNSFPEVTKAKANNLILKNKIPQYSPNVGELFLNTRERELMKNNKSENDYKDTKLKSKLNNSKKCSQVNQISKKKDLRLSNPDSNMESTSNEDNNQNNSIIVVEENDDVQNEFSSIEKLKEDVEKKTKQQLRMLNDSMQDYSKGKHKGNETLKLINKEKSNLDESIIIDKKEAKEKMKKKQRNDKIMKIFNAESEIRNASGDNYEHDERKMIYDNRNTYIMNNPNGTPQFGKYAKLSSKNVTLPSEKEIRPEHFSHSFYSEKIREKRKSKQNKDFQFNNRTKPILATDKKTRKNIYSKKKKLS